MWWVLSLHLSDHAHNCHRYLVVVLNGVWNPSLSIIASDIVNAILKIRSTQKPRVPATYWDKEKQEENLIVAFDKWARKGGIWSAAASKVSCKYIHKKKKAWLCYPDSCRPACSCLQRMSGMKSWRPTIRWQPHQRITQGMEHSPVHTCKWDCHVQCTCPWFCPASQHLHYLFCKKCKGWTHLPGFNLWLTLHPPSWPHCRNLELSHQQLQESLTSSKVTTARKDWKWWDLRTCWLWTCHHIWWPPWHQGGKLWWWIIAACSFVSRTWHARVHPQSTWHWPSTAYALSITHPSPILSPIFGPLLSLDTHTLRVCISRPRMWQLYTAVYEGPVWGSSRF